MKKTILLFAVAILLSMASALAQGGTTGPLTWEINNGTLTISGEGEMPNYFWGVPIPWEEYRDDIHTLIIESGVTNIGVLAFSYFSNLISVSISNTVLTIEDAAFMECKRLPSITFPDGFIRIKAIAFSSCSSLNLVIISKTVAKIDQSAFGGCYSLTSFEVDSENKNYASENGILFNKDKTVLICYPAGKSGAYIIPNNVDTIGNGAFAYCTKLTSITIPNSVISIGAGAFRSCTTLTSIIIPNSVTSIESSTFLNCTSLTSVTIPNSVKNIGYATFRNCENLQLITNLNPVPINIEDNVFWEVNHTACTLEVPMGSIAAYEEADIWKEFNVIGSGFLVNPISNNNEQGYTTGDGLYELNATATVTATARTGYKFVKWTKNGEEFTTANPYSFTVTEDVELVAHFEDYVGVEELDPESSSGTNYELRVYPNPTTGELTIDNGELTINNVEVFDVYGRKQKAEGRKQKAESEMVLDVAHLGSGIYFIKVCTEKGVFVEKIIKN